MPKALTVCIGINCGKFFKRQEHQTTLPGSWEICMQVKNQQLESDMEQQTGSKLGKEYVKAVYFILCLFYLYAEYIIQNATLDETQAWIKIAGRNNNNLRYADDTTLIAETEEELKSLLMKVKEEREKAGLKLNSQKPKIMASDPITSWQVDRETMEATGSIFLGSKIVQMVTIAMKLKDTCSLEENLWPILDSILKNRAITLPIKVHLVKVVFYNSCVWL